MNTEKHKIEVTATKADTKIDIVNLIVKCSKEATKKSDESKFTNSLVELVTKLKVIFNSEYCAIGTVDDKCVIDRACTLNLSKDVKWAPLESESCLVCQSLGHRYNDTGRESIAYYGKSDLEAAGNYTKYQNLLNKDPENTTIIIIQDEDGDPQGYLQFINSESKIGEEDFKPFRADMLRLAFVVKQWYALENERLFLKDFTFVNEIFEDTNNVDKLLKGIMEYLSNEFNAGIISYRIPLLVGTNSKPVFYLRDCFVSEKIDNREVVRTNYCKNRLVKTKDEMGGVDKLICKNQGSPVILAEPKDSGDKIGVSQNVALRKEVIIIPIVRDNAGGIICINNQRSEKKEPCDDGRNCTARFEKYFGLFKLRILKADDENEGDSIPEEVITRLHNLARHISVLLNAVVDKNENKSLETFQDGLNDSSFSDYAGVKDFDLQCAKTIKESTGATVCAIFKYDKLSNEMVLSESTSETTHRDIERENNIFKIEPNLKNTIENCRGLFSIEKDVINQVFESNSPVYYVSKEITVANSLMLVPMMKKDGTRLGMILLIGKVARKGEVSKTYWEQDKMYIKFMVDILSRIEESDAERLVFLLRLSHELRKPITQIVYKNDLLLSTAERNRDNISKKELIEGLRYNMNLCMMFKQIIGDVEASYYRRKGGISHISYNFNEENVKACIIDIIRLFEQGGWSSEKNLTFDTRLTQMPQTMYVDKEKIKQVFVNILKNAIQYSDKYSTITISYNFNENDNCHEIDFRNYGVGISKEEVASIFDLWKRGESAIKKRPNGTGMGLAIVKEIMEAHGGKCYVKQLDTPTIFTVSIPVFHNKLKKNGK